MKKISALILCFTLVISSVCGYGFFDTDTVLWAEYDIDYLASQGILNGYEDGSFKPQNNVTKAEFAKILCLAFDCNHKAEGVDFKEVENHWAFEYMVRTSADVWNFGADYKPDAYATRAEIAYALANVLELDKALQDMNLRFPYDWDSVDDTMKDNVASAVEAGLIQGYEDGKIRGNGFVTRAEISALVVRAMEYGANDTSSDSGDKAEGEVLPGEEGSFETNPEEDEKGNESGDKQEDIFDGLDHLYTVYPLENIYLVTDVSRVYNEKTGSDACRISYTIAGDGDKVYSSVLDEETNVYGSKSDLFSIETGDAFIVDMTFLTKISGIYVLASFDRSFEDSLGKMYVPSGRRISAYGADTDYEILYGKLVGTKTNSKSVSLTVDFGGKEETVHVLKGVDIDLFESGRRHKWDTTSAVSLDEENPTLVYIRLTDGKVTEVLACEH